MINMVATIVELYMEHNCPICRSLFYGVLEKLELEGLIKVDKIDVNSTRGTKKWRKWKRFCSILGYDATPVVMMGPFVFMTWKTREKPDTITEAVLSSLEYFEMHLRKKIKELTKYPDIPYQNSYEMDALLCVNPEVEVCDAGIYPNP